jgi:photosystem II stability/assembly factor-like uncharacterized protein
MRLATCLLVVTLAATPIRASEQQRLDSLLHDSFTYRNLGPFRAGAWICDIAVPEAPLKAHLYTFYVAARGGGVWKTTNNGTSFQPIFDSQTTHSIGCVAVAPSDANQVWVGSGDASCTRSAYWGDGIYKSDDGGRSFTNLGLKDTHHIARMVIHPTNPNIVYVAAMGHLFSTNEERGVFKTTDGGKSWKKILYVNDKTGAIDLAINRQEPDTLYAAMYECQRLPWKLLDGGPGTALFKTTDGGAMWTKLENGLPSGQIGRYGLDIYQKNPNVLYAVVENLNKGKDAAKAGKGMKGGGSMGGEVYKTEDGGASWQKMNTNGPDVSNKSGYAFNQIRVDPNNPNRIVITGSSFYVSNDGGKTFGGKGKGGFFGRAFGDFRTLWIDPENSDRIIAGSDGGVFLSYDGGRSCDFTGNLPLGEIYALTVDTENPYNIYAGLQDHDSWKGPVNGWTGNIGFEHWQTVGPGDGMYNQVDPTDSRWVFNTREFGSHGRYDQKLRKRKNIAPTRPGGPALRFNWVAPLRLSPHDPKTLYAGAEVLLRSANRGDAWEEISPDLTTNDPTKISIPRTTIQHCTITTISESPVTAGVIWVGTDDGKVQLTRNAGKNWTDATQAVVKAGGPVDAWVTRVFASHHDAGSAYVAKSRHRQDDFRPLLYKTTDYGVTWTAIDKTLPQRPVNVVYEDPKNPHLLFVGNDIGVHVSVNGGENWFALRGNMPVVPVHDIVIHPREGDLVAGTYGRGIWVTHIAPLREINEETLTKDVHFFAIQPKARRIEGVIGNYRLTGDRPLTTPNEPNAIILTYFLKETPKSPITLTVADANGKTLRTLSGTQKIGMNRVSWDFRDSSQRILPPGEYVVTLQAGDRKLMQKTRILAGPGDN